MSHSAFVKAEFQPTSTHKKSEQSFLHTFNLDQSDLQSLAKMIFYLEDLTRLKNIGQNGNLPQVGVKIKNIWNHHPALQFFWVPLGL